MDEVFFHIAHHLETLQIHLTSGLQHGRQLAITLGEQITHHAHRVWSVAWSEQIRLYTQTSLEFMKDVFRKCSVVLAQPSEMYFQLTELVRIEMPILYPGSAGFLTGAAIGLIIGLSWQRNVFPVQRMTAVVCMAYDGLDALSCIDDSIIPTITKPQQVVVQVKSASVDIVDIKICYGYGKTLRRLLTNYSSYSTSEFPITLGRDCSGIVVEIGPSVSKLEIGDEVWLVSPFWNTGTIAEYVLTTEDMVAKKPKGMGFEAASSIPYAGCLAYNACLKAGIIGNGHNRKRILIQSGVSPVGCIACQLARLHNFEVTVTCSARAAPVARALGANHVVIYGQIEMENHLLQDRFDVVLNTVGGVCHESCLKLCKPDGIVVSTVPEEIPYDDSMFPMSLVQSIYLKTKYLAKKISGSINQWSDVEFSNEVLDELKKLVEDGHLQPVVDKVFSPKDALLALQHCDSADAIGKTTIRFRTRPDYER